MSKYGEVTLRAIDKILKKRMKPFDAWQEAKPTRRRVKRCNERWIDTA
jgi:hypothetical protein